MNSPKTWLEDTIKIVMAAGGEAILSALTPPGIPTVISRILIVAIICLGWVMGSQFYQKGGLRPKSLIAPLVAVLVLIPIYTLYSGRYIVEYPSGSGPQWAGLWPIENLETRTAITNWKSAYKRAPTPQQLVDSIQGVDGTYEAPSRAAAMIIGFLIFFGIVIGILFLLGVAVSAGLDIARRSNPPEPVVNHAQ